MTNINTTSEIKLLSWLVTLVISLAVIQMADCGNDRRPVIGVLTQEFPEGTEEYEFRKGFIAGPSVQALTASGARVVPLFIGRDLSYYRQNMEKINGVLFPAGEVNLKTGKGYAEAAYDIYKVAIEINEKKVFPILGVGQGFEILSIIAADMRYTLVPCNASLSQPLKFMINFRNSQLYANLPEKLEHILSSEPVTVDKHSVCLVNRLLKRFRLHDYLDVLSTSYDSDGMRFISSFEYKFLPFVGVQFEPERPAYVGDNYGPFGTNAILANRYFYDWLVVTSLKNDNQFPSDFAEKKSLIYHYDVIYKPEDENLVYYNIPHLLGQA